MASFTDQGIQFNPYIQQIPVDEYVRTGMIKQQNYDQGVQRVQQYIDTVAGLPVVGEANKAILTEKLGKLRTAIQGTIGADFGKMNLQMQVGNLAYQVAKDPAIQASVEAARRIQSLESSIAEAKKSGKGYSAANEAYVRDYVQQYVQASNKEAGLSYNGPTSMHSVTADDVHKKIKEAIAPLKGMEDVDYTITDNGKVMLLNEDKLLEGTRIKAAIEATLTGDDRKALSIDGWYNTYDRSDEELVNTATSEYTQIANRATQMADYYENAALLTPGMTESDKDKYKNIANQHREYAKGYLKLADGVKASYGTPNFNREAVAGMMWTEKIENNYAGAYQFRQQKRDQKISPYFEVWQKEQELYYKGIDSETNRIKALTEKEGTGPIGSIQGAEAININPDDPKYQQVYSTKATQNKIAEINEDLEGGAKEQAARAYALTLKDMSNPDAADMSGLVPDASSPDGFKWKSKADRDRVIADAGKGQGNYKVASLNPVFDGVIPYSNRSFREAHLTNIAKGTTVGLLKQSDDVVAKTASDKAGKDWLPVVGKMISIKKKDGTSENITVGELMRIVRDQPKITNESAGLMGGPVSGVSSLQNKVLPKPETAKTLSQIKLGEFDQKELSKVLSQYGVDLTDLNAAKDKVYKEWNKAVNPRMVYTAASDKQKTTGEWDLYQNSVKNNILQGNVIDINGDVISPENAPTEVKGIEISGGYLDLDGKVKMRASWKVGTGDKAKSVTADVDVTNLRNSLKPADNPANDAWLYRNFLGDDLPQLTEGLFRPGSGGRTPFSEKNSFLGSMFVTGNDRVARNYGLRVDPTKPRTIVATVAIPQVVDGKTTFRRVDVGEFTNAGAAKRAIEYMYSHVSDKLSIKDFEENLIKTLGK